MFVFILDMYLLFVCGNYMIFNKPKDKDQKK